MRRFWALITNRFLTAGLLLSFLGLFCVGLVLPQRATVSDEDYAAFRSSYPRVAAASEAIGFDDIYRSTVMHVVFAVFLVQLLAYLGTRTPEAVREALRPPRLDPRRMDPCHERPGSEGSMARLAEVLRQRRYHVTVDGPDRLVAVRNRFSGLGSLVFHASFAVALAGGWMAKTSAFSGYVPLAEGQRFAGTAREYKSFSPEQTSEEDFPAVAFTPERIEPVFAASGGTVDVRCTVRLSDGRTEEIRVNRPLQVGGAAVLLMHYDLAPVVAVKHRVSGQQIDLVCANLNVWTVGHPEDSFELMRPPATVSARFFPDATAPAGAGGSMAMKDPVLALKVEPRAVGVPGAEGRVRPGESLAFGNHELRVVELRKWGMFYVSRQRGELILVGFLLMVAGIAFRFFFLRRWVAARLCNREGTPVLSIGGRAELFPEGFRAELESIVAALPAGEDDGGTDGRD